ncbi:CoA transferase [Azospirillum sp.]|uniref:CoA transferase n=1 Tax=Azospirillum sp. TaxID=34012 RepID=UPI003D73943B
MEQTQGKPAGGPLAGIKVVELARTMAGPVCGLMLADMGAGMITVEKIPGGDDSRRMVPPSIEGKSAAYMMMNRNKRGLALNLKTDEGKEVLRRLQEGGGTGDGEDLVVICYTSHNFREGMEPFLAKRPPHWRGE